MFNNIQYTSTFSVLTLFTGHQEGNLACKQTLVTRVSKETCEIVGAEFLTGIQGLDFLRRKGREEKDFLRRHLSSLPKPL